MIDSVRVLEIDLYGKDNRTAVKLMIDSILSQQATNRCVSATGAHGMVYARKNPQFRDVLNSFFINLPDGMPGVWIGRLKGKKGMMRCYGPDFFMAFLMASSELPIRHFFCGGNPGVAEELKEAVGNKFRNHNVVGTFCPPFVPIDAYPYEEIASIINESGADVVWIGLSTPKQEQFASRLRPFLKVRYIMTVGAAFDFHTGKIRQAPRFISRIGLEWFFRLLIEPKRLYRRYGEVVPLFIFYNLQEFFRFATRKK